MNRSSSECILLMQEFRSELEHVMQSIQSLRVLVPSICSLPFLPIEVYSICFSSIPEVHHPFFHRNIGTRFELVLPPRIEPTIPYPQFFSETSTYPSPQHQSVGGRFSSPSSSSGLESRISSGQLSMSTPMNYTMSNSRTPTLLPNRGFSFLFFPSGFWFCFVSKEKTKNPL